MEVKHKTEHSANLFTPGEIGYLIFEPDGRIGRYLFFEQFPQQGLHISRHGNLTPDYKNKEFIQLVTGSSLDFDELPPGQRELSVSKSSAISKVLKERFSNERDTVALVEPTVMLSAMEQNEFVQYWSNLAEWARGTKGLLLVSIDESALDEKLKAVLRASYRTLTEDDMLLLREELKAHPLKSDSQR